MRGLALAGFVLLMACSSAAQQSSPSAAPDTVARVGDRTITMKEVEDRWRTNDPAQQAQAIQALYDGRRSALDSIIADMLIEEAAKAAKVTKEQYTDTEVSKRVKPVTDPEVQLFYQQNQSQMQGRTLAAMAPAIRRFLGEQQRETAYQALVADLRKAAPRISVLLDAPRQNVSVAADDAAMGSASAPVTIVEFSDFQCPFCARVVPTLKRVKEAYGDRVRIVWKDFPLTSIHPDAFKAAEAGNCAREQGKFWEFHDRLFGNQQALGVDALKQHAVAIGLDAEKFNACLDSSKYTSRVQAALSAGAALGVDSTPATFVNGRAVMGAQPYEAFARVIDEELERATRK